MAAPTTTYRMWKTPSAAQPGGTQLLSAAAMVRVPYFASIVPHVVRMEPGRRGGSAVPKWFFLSHIQDATNIDTKGAAMTTTTTSTDDP